MPRATGDELRAQSEDVEQDEATAAQAFGAALWRVMKERDISARKLSEMSRDNPSPGVPTVSEPLISSWVNGRYPPTAERALHIAELLGLDGIVMLRLAGHELLARHSERQRGNRKPPDPDPDLARLRATLPPEEVEDAIRTYERLRAEAADLVVRRANSV